MKLMQVIDKNVTVNDKIFALVYGGSGTGKTHLTGTLGELGRVLVIDIDQGYKTIVNAPDITPKMKDNITIILTTHYMEEAEILSDRIGIMKDGCLLAVGTPNELIQQTNTENFEAAFVSIIKEAKIWMLHK